MVRGIHHVGLRTADLLRSARFYERAFGFRPGGAQAPTLLRAPNLFVALTEAPSARACSRPRPVNAPGIAHLCVQAADMAPLAATARAAGAAFHAPPTDLGGDILYAYPRDPDGNVVELEAVPHAAAEPGAWAAHVSITTPDLDRLVTFYEALAGAAARRGPRLGPNSKIDLLTGLSDAEVTGAWLPLANAQVEFWHYHSHAPPPDAPDGGYARLAFEIADPADVPAIGARAGVRFAEVALIDGARCFVADDPDGNGIALVAPRDRAVSIAGLADAAVVARVEASRRGAAA